jgi:hypothetical protein
VDGKESESALKETEKESRTIKSDPRDIAESGQAWTFYVHILTNTLNIQKDLRHLKTFVINRLDQTGGPAMIFATISVIALILVVAAKFITAASIQNIRKKAAESDTEIRKVRGAAKAAQNANGFAGRGINTKARKKKTLEKQIEKCRKELAEVKS